MEKNKNYIYIIRIINMNMNNVYNNLTNFTNTALNNLGKSYDVISDNISTTSKQIVPIITAGAKDPAGILKVKENKKIMPITPKINIKPININDFEKKFESQYIGCYADDPSNPSMTSYLGEISNIEQCILLGKEKNYKYVGVQQGNKCYASNNLPITLQADRNTYCNVSCDDVDKGNCGGFFYNQVYETNNNSIKNISKQIKTTPDKISQIMENFNNSSEDINKINVGVQNYNETNKHKPMNKYFLFILICVLVILIYLIFEYLYKKNENII